jgi:hypothetical protein
MSYYVKYEGTKQEKEAKAVQDVKDYLGKNWTKLADNIRTAYKLEQQAGISNRQFMKNVECLLDFFYGISGYPARPFIKYCLRGNNAK